MAPQSDGPDKDAKGVACPLQCWRRRELDGDRTGGAPPSDRVDWAGLPTNLDWAFSRAQRDKVYAQHVMRRRGAQLWRPHVTQLCVCDIEARHEDLTPDQPYARSMRAEAR